MKRFPKYISMLLLGMGLTTSCVNYLDIVPDEIPSDKDAFLDEAAALRYIYSCYSYLPQADAGANSLDFMTGDEVITAFEHETFASFPKGNYTASTPVISYWNTFFQGIRQCHIMLNNVNTVPGLSQADINRYTGEAKFLLAYYHYLLVRCYGATIVVDKEPSLNTSLADYAARRPLDECVSYVCDMFDEAAALLPESCKGTEYGRATSVAAKAFKAKMLVYAASPLFNSDRYKDVVNNDGTNLFPTAADATKWTKAKVALKEAIAAATAAGHELYTDSLYGDNAYPTDGVQRLLRYNFHNAGNSDIIWADCRQGHTYGVQPKSLPCGVLGRDPLWNGVAPTWNMVNRFYTENGLPIDEDPTYNYNDILNITTITDEKQGHVGSKTLQFNINREPRYYAWVAFEGGYYEITNASSSGAFTLAGSESIINYADGRLVTSFVIGGNCSRGTSLSSLRTNNYAPSCFLNKKGVDPDFQVTNGGYNIPEYPWPLMRMGDLYLLYAEACIEDNDLETGKEYLNKIRTHAGIPTVEESWEKIAGVTLTQSKLREIVRRERMNEMYLENQNFWDMRRWLLAEEYFNQKVRGLNNTATTLEELAVVTTYDFERKFSAHQYLLPIPLSDVNKNPNVVQNPGY
jgi:hypothetical protein